MDKFACPIILVFLCGAQEYRLPARYADGEKLSD